MKQDIAAYLVDSFVDYAGKEHRFVACALSQSPEEVEDTLRVGWVDKHGILNNADPLNHEIYRLVTVGIAICNPVDDYDLEKGKQIARHKAAHVEGLPCLYTANKGVITKELVETFLNQQVKFFKENPEKLIPGYKTEKIKYEAGQKAKQAIANLSPEERVAYELAASGIDLSKFSDLAKVYKKYVRDE